MSQFHPGEREFKTQAKKTMSMIAKAGETAAEMTANDAPCWEEFKVLKKIKNDKIACEKRSS